MKKLLGILLVMALCVALVSCGSKAPRQQKINALCEEKGINVTCLIRISINPEFELVLDDQGTVCDVIRLNDDAERVFAQVTDIVMKSYDEAVAELLAAAKNSGYLTDKSTVSVTVILREDCAYGDAVISAVDKTLQEIVSEKQCDMEVWDGRASNDQPQSNDGGNTGDGDDTDDGGQKPEGVEVRDAKGKLVSRTTENQTEEGIVKTTDYFDANEKLTKRVEERNNKIIVCEYDPDGRFISRMWEEVTSEGTATGTDYFDANGKLVSRIGKIPSPLGIMTVTDYFDANETLTKRVEEGETSTSVSEYDADGHCISRVWEGQTPEGPMSGEDYFDANGNKIKEVIQGNGSNIVNEYDDNGRIIRGVQEFINPEGVPETRDSTFSYHESGNLAAEYIYISDGSYNETHYHENGNVVSFYRETPDGGYVNDSYDENGNLIIRKRKFMHDSGAYGLWTDYPDGTSEEYFHEIDGSVWYSWFDAEGFQHGPTRVQ